MLEQRKGIKREVGNERENEIWQEDDFTGDKAWYSSVDLDTCGIEQCLT
jgi:hypothetical protein